jgi:hypothetical protein
MPRKYISLWRPARNITIQLHNSIDATISRNCGAELRDDIHEHVRAWLSGRLIINIGGPSFLTLSDTPRRFPPVGRRLGADMMNNMLCRLSPIFLQNVERNLTATRLVRLERFLYRPLSNMRTQQRIAVSLTNALVDVRRQLTARSQ